VAAFLGSSARWGRSGLRLPSSVWVLSLLPEIDGWFDWQTAGSGYFLQSKADATFEPKASARKYPCW